MLSFRLLLTGLFGSATNGYWPIQIRFSLQLWCFPCIHDQEANVNVLEGILKILGLFNTSEVLEVLTSDKIRGQAGHN